MADAQSHAAGIDVTSAPLAFTPTAPAALMKLIVRPPLLLRYTPPAELALFSVLTAV